MHFVTFVRTVYNMHQDTKSARLIAVCKRTVPLELTATTGFVIFGANCVRHIVLT